MSSNTDLRYFEDLDLDSVFCAENTFTTGTESSLLHYAKDDFIYLKDQEPEKIYLVRRGRVKIGTYSKDGREMVNAILTKGDVFGELALAGELKRQDFAQAMDSNTQICGMTVADARELMLASDTLSFELLKIVGFRLRKMERKIEALIFKDARTRIVDFLKEIAIEKGQKVGYETMIKNHLTHKDIASLTGTSRQTVTTVMNELREKNLINFDRRRILIREIDKLS